MKKIILLSLLAGMILMFSCKKETATPVITINGDNPTAVDLNTDDYLDPGATALDAEDGDLTSSIIVKNNVNFDKKGTYSIQYSVTDSDGKTGYADRVVYVVNRAQYLGGEYNVTDEKLDPSGTPTTTIYIEMIATHDTVNNRIWFIQFGAHQGGLVYADRDGDILSIPQQEVTCGTPPETRRFIGTGNILDSTSLIINYTEIVNGQNWTGSGNYVKQ